MQQFSGGSNPLSSNRGYSRASSSTDSPAMAPLASSGSGCTTTSRPSGASGSQESADHIVWGAKDESSEESRAYQLLEGVLLKEEESSFSEEAERGSPQMTDFDARLNARLDLIKKGVDVDRLLELVPRDDEGNPSSYGSIGHVNGRCKGKCALLATPKGCAKGIYCNACHLPHTEPKKRVKIGKSKRDRYRKLKEDMLLQIEADPEDFQFDVNRLPESIAKDGRLTGKLMKRLRTHQDQCKKRIVEL